MIEINHFIKIDRIIKTKISEKKIKNFVKIYGILFFYIELNSSLSPKSAFMIKVKICSCARVDGDDNVV